MRIEFYRAEISEFLSHSENYILGEMTKNNQFDLNDLQRNTWLQEIEILKNTLKDINNGTIIFEYTIPRIGSRVDTVLLINGVVYLVEFKCGGKRYESYAKEQVMDYALDLKNFHLKSRDIMIVPILVATNAPTVINNFEVFKDNIANIILCNQQNFRNELICFISTYQAENFDINEWIDSPYSPTPTIIEAAQVMYATHNVEDIKRKDAGTRNLDITAEAIDNIINGSKKLKKKSICFITGVPGAGKTLAGLNIAAKRHIFEEEEHAVFLSGNGPLVEVLQEALARDDAKRHNIKKKDAERKAKSFIQIIHHFRDEAISTSAAPLEKVAIFDEAQRAWDSVQTSKFMRTKKHVIDFNMSEPEFLISIMDRHKDWAVIVCLVGGGQEINVGEAGIIEWFEALKKDKFKNWNVYLSNNMIDSEYSRNNIFDQLNGLNYKFVDGLHLDVSIRSFRSDKLASFVKNMLDLNIAKAKEIYLQLKNDYPIVVTRNLDRAKKWVKNKARGSERYGLIASSGAKRLRSDGIWVQSKINIANWFLDGKEDVRSSFYLEDTATEFDIQGLELDYSIVAWDADFRFNGKSFNYYKFSGSKWKNINSEADQRYLKNAYRVLLTRARQGIAIYVPKGSNEDKTRPCEYYDNTYILLRSLGIQTLDDE